MKQALLIFGVASALASTVAINSASAFPLFPNSVVAYGDSIMSGYNSEGLLIPIPGGDLLKRFTSTLGSAFSNLFNVRNKAVPGFVMSSIVARIRLSPLDVRGAKKILLNGGGNDFLGVSHKADLCDPQAFATALANVKSNWATALELIRGENADADLRTMNIYFPFVRQYRDTPCVKGVSAFQLLLPLLSKANHAICSLTWSHGGKCADIFAEFNCPKSIRGSCAVRGGESSDAYVKRILKLADQMDDPGEIGLLQRDGIHPNSQGHGIIADVLSWL